MALTAYTWGTHSLLSVLSQGSLMTLAANVECCCDGGFECTNCGQWISAKVGAVNAHVTIEACGSVYEIDTPLRGGIDCREFGGLEESWPVLFAAGFDIGFYWDENLQTMTLDHCTWDFNEAACGRGAAVLTSYECVQNSHFEGVITIPVVDNGGCSCSSVEVVITVYIDLS